MAAINWVFLCDYAFLANGKGSIIGMFNEMFVKKLPYIHNQLFVVASITIVPNDGAVRIGCQISSPGGNSVAFAEHPPFSTHGGIDEHKTVFGFYSLPFAETGEYHFEIFINGQSVHVIPLPVKLVR